MSLQRGQTCVRGWTCALLYLVDGMLDVALHARLDRVGWVRRDAADGARDEGRGEPSRVLRLTRRFGEGLADLRAARGPGVPNSRARKVYGVSGTREE